MGMPRVLSAVRALRNQITHVAEITSDQVARTYSAMVWSLDPYNVKPTDAGDVLAFIRAQREACMDACDAPAFGVWRIIEIDALALQVAVSAA